jgi:hypothetical protein
MKSWSVLLLVALVLPACGPSADDLRIRELKEQISQLESENARLRKLIPPEDPGAPGDASPSEPRDVAGADGWKSDSPLAGAVEEPPPADLVAVSRAMDEQAVAAAEATEPVEPVEHTEPATPEPAVTTESTEPGDPRLIVHRAVAATGVSNRAPVGEATTFSPSVGKVYCYTEVSPADAAAATTSLVHRWYRGDRPEGETRLKVAGSHWRTYSNRTVSESKMGGWRVELVDSAGNILQTVRFTVE